MTETKEFKFKSMREIMEDNPGEFNDGAYRRGYDQGYWAAIQDIKEYGITRAEKHQETELYNWRFRGDLNEITWPPTIKE